MQTNQTVNCGDNIIQHDAQTAADFAVDDADGDGFEDVKDAKQYQSCCQHPPKIRLMGREMRAAAYRQKRDKNAGKFIPNNAAVVVGF